MVRDALIAKKGRYGWRWCVVPVEAIDAFRDHGWINVLNADEMQDVIAEAIEDVRQSEERTWSFNTMRFFPGPSNG